MPWLIPIGALAAAALALAFYAFVVEPRWITVERVAVFPERWPKALDGLLIGQLSDLHFGEWHTAHLIPRAIALLEAAKPDLVALTGDYTLRGHRVERSARALDGVRTRPAFAVLGNHDYKAGRARADALAAALSGLGFKVLRNDSVECQVRGSRLWVVGLDDYCFRRDDFAAAVRDLAPSDQPRLLLSHSPVPVTTLPGGAFDLALAGHTHGGQIWVPGLNWLFGGSLYSRFFAGTLEREGSILRVSRGLASVGIPARFLRRPEVTLITVRARDD